MTPYDALLADGANAATESLPSRIRGSSEMAEAIRAHPWVDTTLGPIVQWSSELTTAVNLVLSSKLISCLIWGPERILLYNDLYKPLLGTKTASLGESFLDVWAEIRDQAEALISEPSRTNEANIYEKVPFWILLDGKLVERICTLTNSPVWAEHAPEVVGIYQTIIDHTEGVLAERKLRESESRLQQSYAELQAIYESGAVAAALIDSKTFCYLRVNSKLAEMLDTPVHAIVGTCVFDLASDVIGLRSQLAQVALGASLIGVASEGVLSNSPGEHRYWQSSYVPVRSEQGEIIAIAAASLEVTAQRRAEAMLRQNEKLAAVGRLASSISHEINNPLESVTNLLYLVRGSSNLTEIYDYIDTAERELRRVSIITNQTLGFHKHSTKPDLLFCHDLISESVSVYQGRLINSQIEVEKRKRAQHPIHCFGGEIRQVLSNLMGNAIDSMPTGGRLLLRSRESTLWETGARGVVLTIADTGTGMSQEVIKKIFGAFYTTKGIGGTGLGLWISSEIVAKHHGKISVRSSQQKGRTGTVFTVFLPFEVVVRD